MQITAAIAREIQSPEESGSALHSSAGKLAKDTGGPVAGREFINNSKKEGICDHVETESAWQRDRIAEPRAHASFDAGHSEF
jgi:hypothetical protein